MWLDWRIFILVFQIISPKLVHSQTSEMLPAETKNDSVKDAKKEEVVLDKCCKNKELFDIITNKCIKFQDELPSATSSHKKELTLGEYSKTLI